MMRQSTYEQNQHKFYTIHLVQFSENFNTILEGIYNWYAIHNDHDMVKILKSIKAHMITQ